MTAVGLPASLLVALLESGVSGEEELLAMGKRKPRHGERKPRLGEEETSPWAGDAGRYIYIYIYRGIKLVDGPLAVAEDEGTDRLAGVQEVETSLDVDGKAGTVGRKE